MDDYVSVRHLSDDAYVELIDSVTVRRCGDCDLCCSAMEVFDLVPPKPLGCRCPHQCASGPGCTIYESRPSTCKVFYCLWRAGSTVGITVPHDLYPARCGFVLVWDLTNNPYICTAFLDPQRPKKWVHYKRDLEKLARKWNCGIAIGGGDTASHVLTPMGSWFARADFPELFVGLEIGIPREEFINGRPRERIVPTWPRH